MNPTYKFIMTMNKFNIDVYLCKHCNLKCRACSRYSCISEPDFYSLNDLKNDLKFIKNSQTKLNAISFSGGEPLLHPELQEILKFTRSLFPEIYISIVTNGVLFKKLGTNFYETLAKTNVHIICSEYPIDVDYDYIKKICISYNIKYYNVNKNVEQSDFEIQKTTFWTNRLSEQHWLHNDVKRFYLCNNDCCCLWKGKIYKCCSVPFINTLNKKYGTHFEVKEDDFLKVDDTLTEDKIIRFFLSSCDFCKYCFNCENQEIKWECKNPKQEDWIL